MSLYEHWQRKDFAPLLRFYSSMVIKDHNTVNKFVRHLGLFKSGMSMSVWEKEAIVRGLFGFGFDTARDVYKDHYFGRLQITINA